MVLLNQLVPLHPDRMKPFLASDGTIHYEHRQLSGRTEILLQDEVFHISTLSDDSIQGMSILALARNTFGLAKATEDYGSRFFSGGQKPAGTLTLPGKLSQEGRDRLKTDWKGTYGGVTNSQNIALLEEGMEWHAMGVSNEDSQFLETRIFQVEEIASWFGVPLSLLQHTTKATSWGTGIGELTLGFVKFTMQPWLTRWEQEIQQDLILNKDRFFAEFVLEGLLRGDPKTRGDFYGVMIDKGIMSQNEVRILESLNPIPGLDLPQRMPQRAQSNALALELAQDIAARMVRKETGQIEKASKKYAGDSNGWTLWVAEFYDGFRAELMQHCKLDPQDALTYSNAQRDTVLAFGVAIVDTWGDDRAGVLVTLMIGELR